MVITEPAVLGTWLLSLDLKLYPRNKQLFLNKDRIIMIPKILLKSSKVFLVDGKIK